MKLFIFSLPKNFFQIPRCEIISKEFAKNRDNFSWIQKKRRDKYDFDLRRLSFFSKCVLELEQRHLNNKTKHETTHAERANKQTARSFFAFIPSCQTCHVTNVWVFLKMKNSHAHFMPIITIIYTHLLDFYSHSLAGWVWRAAPQTPIIIERFRFILLFIFSTVSLGNTFMTAQKKTFWSIKGNAKKYTHCNFHFSFLYRNYSTVELYHTTCMKRRRKKSSQIALYRVSIYQFFRRTMVELQQYTVVEIQT